MNETPLSTAIKQLRKEYNLTQQDLAYKSGVGLRFVRETWSKANPPYVWIR